MSNLEKNIVYIGIIYDIEIWFVKLYTWTQQNKGTFNSLSWPQFSIVTFRRNEVSDFYSHLHNILICSLSFQPKVWIWVWVWRGIWPSFVHCCPLSSRVGWKIENVKNSLWTWSSYCNSQKKRHFTFHVLVLVNILILKCPRRGTTKKI